MKAYPLTLVTLSILTLGLIGCNDSDSSTYVFHSTQQTQCHDDGLSLSEVESYLTDVKIAPTQSLCGKLTGIATVSVCGAATDDIYLFEIDNSELVDAENAGFSSVDGLHESLGVEVVECSD